MSGHKSLVVFTLLVQSAVGIIWLTGISMVLGIGEFHAKYSLIVAFLLVIAGMAVSTGHLGRPYVCYYALRNLRNSWVSREIAATGAFAALLAVAILSDFISGSLSGLLILILCVAGGFTLYAMVRSYQLRTVPSWNHSGTLCTFLGSTLILGGLQDSLTTGILTMGTGNGYYPVQGLLMAAVGLSVKALARNVNLNKTVRRDPSAGFSQSILLIGIVCWVISVICRQTGGVHLTFLLLTALFVIAGEIRQRATFYHSFQSAGF
jgi:DMSO reductase anchor subunit